MAKYVEVPFEKYVDVEVEKEVIVPVEKVREKKVKKDKIVRREVEVEKIVEQYFGLIESNLSENDCLEKLRDALLPKLLSGQLEISEVA